MDSTRRTARILNGWIRRAGEGRDIGEAERWEPLRVPAGQLPPACPYCKTYSLRVGRREGRVRCANRWCVDGDGKPPVATIDKNRLNGEQCSPGRTAGRSTTERHREHRTAAGLILALDVRVQSE